MPVAEEPSVVTTQSGPAGHDTATAYYHVGTEPTAFFQIGTPRAGEFTKPPAATPSEQWLAAAREQLAQAQAAVAEAEAGARQAVVLEPPAIASAPPTVVTTPAGS